MSLNEWERVHKHNSICMNVQNEGDEGEQMITLIMRYVKNWIERTHEPVP